MFSLLMYIFSWSPDINTVWCWGKKHGKCERLCQSRVGARFTPAPMVSAVVLATKCGSGTQSESNCTLTRTLTRWQSCTYSAFCWLFSSAPHLVRWIIPSKIYEKMMENGLIPNVFFLESHYDLFLSFQDRLRMA